MATFSRMSWAATSMGRFRLNVTMRTELPGLEMERSS